jgi:sec-independent protein translocase protein TatA
MGNVGATEIILIVFIILIFFGSKKIPELAQGLGKGIKEFRKAARDIQEDDEPNTKKIEGKPTEESEKKG